MESNKITRILFKGDRVVWIVFITLCAISWVEVFSATSRQTFATGNYWNPIIKHTAFIIGGIVVVWFMHNLNAKWIDKFTKAIYWFGVAGLIYAQFQGSRVNDSARWISIMGFTFQPMEFAKMGLVMMTSRIISNHLGDEGTDKFALKEIAKYSILPILIILKENLSSAVLLTFTIYLLMIIGGLPKRQLLATFGIGVAIVALGVGAIIATPESAAKSGSFGNKVVTWKHRILGAADSGPITAEEYRIDSQNEQRTYSHIAIASSHLIGRGPGNSIQRDFIPHAYSDYIFAVIIEELGLIGAIAVMMLYLTLLYRCGKIADKCDDPYLAYLVMGIGLIIITQALMHMYISVSNFVTGQPLPLMSQGGTSFVINSMYIGFILSISRYAMPKKDKMVEKKSITPAVEVTEN